jgi:hypothetical protein
LFVRNHQHQRKHSVRGGDIDAARRLVQHRVAQRRRRLLDLRRRHESQVTAARGRLGIF